MLSLWRGAALSCSSARAFGSQSFMGLPHHATTMWAPFLSAPRAERKPTGCLALAARAVPVAARAATVAARATALAAAVVATTAVAARAATFASVPRPSLHAPHRRTRRTCALIARAQARVRVAHSEARRVANPSESQLTAADARVEEVGGQRPWRERRDLAEVARGVVAFLCHSGPAMPGRPVRGRIGTSPDADTLYPKHIDTGAARMVTLCFGFCSAVRLPLQRPRACRSALHHGV